MSNTVAANLDGRRISDAFFASFKARLAPVTSFATDFSGSILRGVKTVNIPLYGPASSEDFAGDYSASPDTVIEEREVAIDRHKFDTINLSDTEAATTQVEFERLAEDAGSNLAEEVFKDMLNPITVVDYYYEVVKTAALFDGDSVVDMKALADENKMPKNDRTLLLGDSYYNNLIKDPSIKNSNRYGSPEAIQQGTISGLYGCDIRQVSSIPDNGEHLEGLLVYPSALAIAMRYLKPESPEVYTRVDRYTDPETGITVGVREFYETQTGHRYMVFECNYGRDKGLEEACVRVVSTETLFSIDDEAGNSILDEGGFAILYK